MKKIIWFFSASVLFVAFCQQPDNVDLSSNVSAQKEEGQNNALLVAKNFDALFTVIKNKNGSKKNARASNEGKSVKRIRTIKDTQQNALYHIITYNEGGFIVVSAEKRARPILAFSDTNDFPIEQEFPAGVKEIMNSYGESIQQLRLKDGAADPNISREWERLENTVAITGLADQSKNSGGRVLEQPVDPGCQDSQIYVTLNTASWGQTHKWNSYMPLQLVYGCTGLPNGRMYTGCVATAMAEVMNYHKHPNVIHWNEMGPNLSETAYLMRQAANSVNMMYNCNGSGAYLSAVPAALVGSFGYSPQTNWSNSFNAGTVENEILNFARPVILGGVKANSGGHAWVCDGYYQYISCTSSNGPLFHMNWGWDGEANGFYAPSAADPYKQGVYFTQRAMVTSIKKP